MSIFNGLIHIYAIKMQYCDGNYILDTDKGVGLLGTNNPKLVSYVTSRQIYSSDYLITYIIIIQRGILFTTYAIMIVPRHIPHHLIVTWPLLITCIMHSG